MLDDWTILIVGDRKTPLTWDLDGATYLSVDDQHESSPLLSPRLKLDHYCRKNIGYLAAINAGARCIAETDDDNFPKDTFLGDM